MGFERIGEINDIITITPSWQELDLTGKQAIVGMVELDDVAVAIRTDNTNDDAYITIQPGQPFPPRNWRFGIVEVWTAPYETDPTVTSHLQLINHATTLTVVLSDVQVGITMTLELDDDFNIPDGSTRRLLTSKPPFYREDYEEYLRIMKKSGFQPQNITQSKLA